MIMALMTTAIIMTINFVFFSLNPYQEGTFPICYAAMQGHLSVVKYLLQQELNTERLLSDRKVSFHPCRNARSKMNARCWLSILRTCPVKCKSKLLVYGFRIRVHFYVGFSVTFFSS